MRLPGSNGVANIDWEWSLIKLSLILVWLPMLGIMIYGSTASLFPTGICKLYSFDPLFTPIGKPILLAVVVLMMAMYLFEVRMLFTTFMLFLLACIIISYHESNGIFFRATVVTTVFGAQFLAYLRKRMNSDFDLKKFRIQYAVQIIAATYTLAGIAKVATSGLDWVNGGELFSLQVMKNYSFQYFDTGSEAAMQQGKDIAYSMIKYRFLLKFMLGTSLALELFCLLAALGNRLRLAFGIGLLLMHIGIMIIMGIGISAIAFPMVIIFINPLYRMKQLVDRLRNGKGLQKAEGVI